MSTDFTTGKNKNIGKDDLLLTSCNVLANILETTRESLYDFYVENKVCQGSGQWGYFDRYNFDFNSNDYVGNKLDNIIILSSAIEKPEFLDKNDSTIESRRNLIKSLCSSMINDGKCNEFNDKLSGLFPHLDKPNDIDALSTSIGYVPCEEAIPGYETCIPIISYTDSCGCNMIEPVPQYPLNYQNSLLTLIGTDKEHRADGAEFQWEIISGSELVKVSPETSSMKEDHIDIATLSTTMKNDIIQLKITYKEN